MGRRRAGLKWWWWWWCIKDAFEKRGTGVVWRRACRAGRGSGGPQARSAPALALAGGKQPLASECPTPAQARLRPLCAHPGTQANSEQISYSTSSTTDSASWLPSHSAMASALLQALEALEARSSHCPRQTRSRQASACAHATQVESGRLAPPPPTSLVPLLVRNYKVHQSKRQGPKKVPKAHSASDLRSFWRVGPSNGTTSSTPK